MTNLAPMNGVCVSCSLKVAKQLLRLVCTSELRMTLDGRSCKVCAAKAVDIVVPVNSAAGADGWPTPSPLTSRASSLRAMAAVRCKGEGLGAILTGLEFFTGRDGFLRGGPS